MNRRGLMGFFASLFGVQPKAVARIDRSSERQLAFEAEGAAAGALGAKQEDCPYDEKAQSFEWNHWVYGWSLARYEYDAMQRGTVDVQCYTTIYMEHIQPTMMGVEEAYQRGYWTPKYVTVPEHWTREAA